MSPGSSVPQQQCLPQVWRSETVVQVFLDFWLEYTEDAQLTSQLTTSYLSSIPRRVSSVRNERDDILYLEK